MNRPQPTAFHQSDRLCALALAEAHVLAEAGFPTQLCRAYVAGLHRHLSAWAERFDEGERELLLVETEAMTVDWRAAFDRDDADAFDFEEFWEGEP